MDGPSGLGIKEESIKKKKRNSNFYHCSCHSMCNLFFIVAVERWDLLQGLQQVGLEHGGDEAHCNNCPPVETIVLIPD